ncbi:MAG: tRNA (adenosine(37)-N6)-dimethylallyltransferase MiaA [Bacteroidota bacterium]
MKSLPTKIPNGNEVTLTNQPLSKKSLVVVGGPTASGKTALAISIAQQLSAEIVSADSRQFFKELTIGTAKPDKQELSLVKHHFIDSHSVSEDFNASDYGAAATTTINKLFETSNHVVMVGGSGLFIDAVIKGFDELPPSDEQVRAELQERLSNEGIEALQEQLKQLDPASYEKIDIKNPRRVLRALEVCIVANQPYSTLIGKERNPTNDWNTVMVGIEHPREELYRRIDERTAIMIASGLKDETISVLSYRSKNALRTVGYTEMFEHLDGKIDLEETQKLIAQHTRNYAKRQMTWFNRYDNMNWLQPGSVNQMTDRVLDLL